MNAAAMTNSGNAINVVELSWSIMFCATPTSGWSDTKYSTDAQVPSTRKIGMPAASRPKNNNRKPTAHMPRVGLFDDWLQQFSRRFVRDRTTGRHRRRIEPKRIAQQPDHEADQHQQAAGRQRGIVDPQRELQVR